MPGEPGHDPRHQFDCGRCKFSWCCGPNCACVLAQAIPLHLTPESRIREVARIRRKAGLRGAAGELRKDWTASRLKAVAEVMES